MVLDLYERVVDDTMNKVNRLMNIDEHLCNSIKKEWIIELRNDECVNYDTHEVHNISCEKNNVHMQMVKDILQSGKLPDRINFKQTMDNDVNTSLESTNEFKTDNVLLGQFTSITSRKDRFICDFTNIVLFINGHEHTFGKCKCKFQWK
jgi:hypothetical protein